MENAHPSIDPAVRVVSLEGGLVAYHTKRDVVHRLNPTAAYILALCDGHHEVAQIMAAVTNARPTESDSSPGAEVDAWLTQAEADGLVSSNGAQLPNTRLGEITVKQLAKLAERLHDQGDIELAYQCQQRATQLDPDNAGLWYDLGEMAHALNLIDAARTAYERYLEFVPDDAATAHLVIALSDQEAPPRASDDCIVQTFDQFAETYDELMVDELEYRAPQLLFEQMKQQLPEPASQWQIADLGCGTGLAGKLFKPWARQMVGIDLSAQMASHACATGAYDQIHVAELIDWLRRVEHPFDLMVSCDVLIYFGDLHEIIAASATALAPGGRLGFSLERDEGDGFSITVSGRYAHSLAHVESAAAAAGLRVVTMTQAALRKEYAKAVAGLVVVLEHADDAKSR